MSASFLGTPRGSMSGMGSPTSGVGASSPSNSQSAAGVSGNIGNNNNNNNSQTLEEMGGLDLGRKLLALCQQHDQRFSAQLQRKITSSTSSKEYTQSTTAPGAGGPTDPVTMASSRNSNNSIGDAGMPFFATTQRMEFPGALVDQYSRAEVKCFMGLFTSINRAWLTIDNKIFLWNYSNQRDFCLFEDLDQIIVCAALVKPAPGVFVSNIQYVLVLSTPVEVVMLGVAFADPNNVDSDLSLYPTQLRVPSDGVAMLSISAHPNGRIFMAGEDGHVYEFVYGASGAHGAVSSSGRVDNKFSFGISESLSRIFIGSSSTQPLAKKVCRTSQTLSGVLPSFLLNWSTPSAVTHVVVDGIKQALYTVNAASHISVYDLHNGFKFHHVSTLTSVGADADRMIPGGRGGSRSMKGTRGSFRIVSLCTVSEPNADLVAVTNSGARLYFKVPRLSSYVSSSSQLTITMVHVRLPPTPPTVPAPTMGASGLRTGGSRRSFQPGQQNGEMGEVHSAFVADGVAFLSEGVNHDDDRVHAMMLDPVSGNHSLALTITEPQLQTVSFNNNQQVGHAGPAGPTAAAALQYRSQDPAVAGTSTAGRTQLDEASTLVTTMKKTWSMAEVPIVQPCGILEASTASSKLSALQAQHVSAARRFVRLTSKGVDIIDQLRPIDQLARILAPVPPPDAEVVAQFVNRYSPDEACAMCVSLIVEVHGRPTGLVGSLGTASAGVDVNPRSGFPTPNGAVNMGAAGKTMGAENIAHAANMMLVHYSGQPTTINRGGGATTAGGVMNSSSVPTYFGAGAAAARRSTGSTARPRAALSSFHNGVALYLTRLLSPVWDANMFVATTPRTGAGNRGGVVGRAVSDAVNKMVGNSPAKASTVYSLGVRKTHIRGILTSLEALVNFMGDWTATTSSTGPVATPAELAETKSLQGLLSLAKRSHESLSFLSLLEDHGVNEVCNRAIKSSSGPSSSSTAAGRRATAAAASGSPGGSFAPKVNVSQHTLSSLKFAGLLGGSPGPAPIARVLSLSLMEVAADAVARAGVGAGSAEAIDSLGSVLQNRCKSFFSTSDFLGHRGLQWVLAASLPPVPKLSRDLALGLDPRSADYDAQARRVLLKAGVDLLLRVPSEIPSVDRVHALLLHHRAYSELHRVVRARAVVVDPSDLLGQALLSGAGVTGGVGVGSNNSSFLGFPSTPARGHSSVLTPRSGSTPGAATSLSPSNVGAAKLQEVHVARMNCYSPIIEALREVIGEQVAPMLDDQDHKFVNRSPINMADKTNLLSVLASSPDPVLHHVVYAWYLEKNLSRLLVQFNTPHIEGFLRRENPALLAQHLTTHRRYLDAALVHLNLADSPDESVNLMTRVEHLSAALHAARSESPVKTATVGGEDGGTTVTAGNLLTDIRDKVDVAQAQLAVLSELDTMYSGVVNGVGGPSSPSSPGARQYSSQEGSAARSAASALNCRLFTISELYNDFARPLGLDGSCLTLFGVSGEDSQGLVLPTWTRIVQSALGSSGQHPAAQEKRLKLLFSKVVSLGKLHAHSPVVMPLEDLIPLLEHTCFTQSTDKEAAALRTVEALREMGVLPHAALQQYDRLLSRPPPELASTDAQLHLLKAVLNLVTKWREISLMPAASATTRRSYKDACPGLQDHFSQYMLVLNALPRNRTNQLSREFTVLRENVANDMYEN